MAMHPLSPEESERLLNSQMYGHLGFWDGARPHVLPITYLYKKDAIYSFSLPGEKCEIMRKNPRVCFQVEDTAAQDEWRSVQVWGRYEEIEDILEQEESLQQFIRQHWRWYDAEGKEPFSTLRALEEWQQSPAKEIIVYRIAIEEMTGRKRHQKGLLEAEGE